MKNANIRTIRTWTNFFIYQTIKLSRAFLQRISHGEKRGKVFSQNRADLSRFNIVFPLV